MTPASARRTAWLLFLALFACYLSLSQGTIEGRGYIQEELDSGMRMLTVFNQWVKGRPMEPLLWSRHGPTPVLFDLPFLKLGKFLISPSFALSLQPPLFTAGLLTLLFIWLRRFCTPGMSLLLTLTGAFGTMLWPYAYIGLEPKQSFFVMLSGFLGLAGGKIRRWPRLLLFAASCGLAMSVKSVGAILWPAIAYLVYVQFRDDWRARRAQALAVIFVIASIAVLSVVTWRFYWTPIGGGSTHLQMWLIESPMEFLINVLGIFGSPTKGLFLFAPVLLLGLWAVPRVFQSHRDTAIFALLVTGCTVSFLSILVTPVDEVWGPRFMHIAIAPLLVCIGLAWPRFQWQKHVPLLMLAGAGLVVSFLGAFYYYGARGGAIGDAGQNTMEWLTGDRVWNEVTFNAQLFRVWLRGGSNPIPWTPDHIWVWSAPPDAPSWKTIDLRRYADPQSFMLYYWNQTLAGKELLQFRIYQVALAVGLLSLLSVVLRTAREGPAVADLANTARRANHANKVMAAAMAVIVIVTILLWKRGPDHSNAQLLLNRTEVVAGSDAYVLSIKDMPNTLVEIRYSIDYEEPKIFATRLDGNGDARFEVGPGTRKGSYRMLAFSKKNSLIWHDARAVIIVK